MHYKDFPIRDGWRSLTNCWKMVFAPLSVIPSQAGIQAYQAYRIPVFTGMTN